ncbi:MAG TPA: pilus assembly protein TadG-related protein [Nocardioides sp.]
MRRTGDDGGGVLVIVALCLPVFVVFITLVVDVGNWFVHKRHLQMQADAGALAGGGLFTFPCSDNPILAETRKYAGDPANGAPYNLQVAPTDQANVHVLVNSDRFWNEGGTDFSDGGPPCAARMVDVKITEASLPWFFGLNVVPAINAHARVMIQALRQARGALPVAVPDVDPRRGHAYFVDETSGALLASTPLTMVGTSNGLAVWDNAAAPVSVPINSSRIGVRIALGGGPSSTCGEYLVECYDLASQNGIVFVRGYPSTGSATQPNPPIARDVRLYAASCPDGYFHDSSASCSIGVSADVDFGVADPAVVGAKVSAVVAGTEHALSYDATSGRWVSTTYFGVAPGAGPVGVELKWEETSGTVSGNNCTTTGGNRCRGTFGIVQRTFSATAVRSGPVKQVEIYEGGVPGANSFATGTTHDLVVRIAIAGNLEVAQSVSDPLVELRVTGGSQNQSIDCDPNLPNLRDEIEQGCAPLYAINEGAPCPSTAPSLWASPQPWDCVAVQTGGAVGQLEQGMRGRILGGASSCTSPNNWASFPNIPADDPRIVPVFVTPFGTFTGSGNEVVPVSKFATFYVTGWFSSPCPNDDPVPDRGYVVGHFIKYIYVLNNGGGSGELCDFDAFGSCIAVLTE